MTGLTNEEAHTFELHAVNAAGAGDAATAGPVTPTPGICDRTQQIQNAILAEIADVDDCAAVTVANLASITTFGGLGTGTISQGISSLKKGDFAGLTALTVLNLSRNTLTSLPEGIFAGLAALTDLDLANNQLTSLPEGVFSELVTLESISLGGNSLTELRAGEFAGQTAPENLNVAFNDLSSLPDGVFSDLTTLSGLYLNHNELSSLDAGVFSDLTALTRLDLNNNGLGPLDAGLFSGLTALTELYLDDNALGSLPEELFLGLASLRTLYLDGNTNTLPLTVTVEKVGTNQVRAKVLAGTPFAVDFPVTLVNGTLTGSVTELSVAAGEVYSEPVTMTRTAGTTAAATVDVDLTTQPTLPTNHRGYEFVKATVNLPATILPDATNAAPAFTSSATFNPAENQTAVGTVEAEDSDTTDDITGYALNGGADQALFSITSGVLTFQAAPNYEDPKDANTDNAYVVVVRATSGTGARVKTADQTITVTVMDVAEQPDKPAQPTLAAVSGSSTSLVASWTEPGLNGGPDITGYEVNYRVSTVTAWETFTHSGAGVTRTITGLTASTSYQVRVRALNGETPSDWSDPSEAVSTNAAADPPTVVSVAVKSAPQSGYTYGWGETIVFTLTFSEKVRVTGQPQPTLAFDLGGSTREARYAGMTDTDVDSNPRPRPRPEGVKVHFYYTVQSGDQDNDGIQVGELASAIDLGGARIQSAADLVDADGHKVDGVDANLAHAALGRLPTHTVDGGTAQPAGPGITIIDTHGNPLTDNRLTLRESTRGRYGFKLNTRPTHTVWVVAVASDGDPDLHMLPTANAEMAITPDEWETPFYIELRAAIDDDEEIGERVFLNRSSSQDPAYHDLILPGVVVVEDERADDAGALSVADAEATEGVDETLDYRTQDGTATAGSDYTLMSGTLTFAPGQNEKTVSVPIADDTVEDSGETLTLVLSNATGAGFASFGREALGTIWNTETAATGTPTISGTPQVGETLTADTSGIADEDGLENVSFSYQWLADGTAIQGATNSTYTPIEADEGKAITVGETLTADTSGISDADRLTSVTHSYQWLADDTAIQGATNTTYTLVEADEGKAIKVRVSFTDDGGNDETLTSAATEAVAGNKEPLTSEDAAAWSATMTVEWVYQDYGYYSTDAKKAGSLSPASFEVDGTTYTVKMVETQGWWMYIGVDRELPFDFVLELDGVRFASGDASFASYSYGNIYRCEGTGLSWRDGDTVEVRLLRAFEDETAVNSPATGQPTISGTVQVGETLTADTSGIADEDGLDNVSFSYQWLADNAAIAGATGSTYTLADADEGKAIAVQVSFTDDAGNDETLASAATDAVAAAPPENNEATGAPSISGTAQVGETLTVDTSGIADTDGLENSAFTYQWLADDTAIQGAMGSSYTLADTDEGKTIKVRVSFTDDTGNGETLTSTATDAVAAATQPNNPATGAPAINGTAQVGETLTADTSGIGDTDGLTSVTYSYQWLAGDSDISGATGSTYTLADADEGKTVTVRVSFTDDGGNDETLTSAATDAVTAAPPENNEATGAPSISGTAQVGETLTADTSGISDADGLTNVQYEYQWLADGTAIQGATGSTYTLVEADEGKPIKVRVSFTDDGGNDETLTSAATEAVAGNEEPVAREDVAAWSATMTVEWVYQGYGYYSTDTKKAGSLSPASFEVDGTTYTVKMVETQGWMYIGVDRELPFDFVLELDGARFASNDASFRSYSYGNIYKWERTGLRWRDGDTVEVRLLRGFEDETAVNSAATGAPIISGTVQVGETLTADTSGIADEDGPDNASFAYQWIANEAEIAGATGLTYTLSVADEGRTVKVQVSFTDDADNGETLTSAATDAVAAATQPNNPATGAPTISGTAQVGETLTADTSGIADVDGLDNVSYSYQWLADNAAIAGATGSTYTLAADDEGKAVKVPVSFTDDAGYGETLTSPATGIVAAALLPLTASLENMPDTHDGQNVFTFELRFSEEVSLSYKMLRDHAFTVAGGTVEKAERITKGSNLRWLITVRPDGDGQVAITLPATTDCDAEGAICTGDGRMLSNDLVLTVSGPGQ